MSNFSFPKNFIWGCATASYQVEGAAYEDSRSESIWDIRCRQPGKVYAGENGNVAIDQYHRYREDVALMKKLGIQSYRFSIAWPRIVPSIDGDVNEKGICYYRNLCDELHKAGIKATATLYHWDLPQYIEETGGWLNRDTSYRFEQYANICFKYLGEYVDSWITLNEPWCSSYLGYYEGRHAPGKTGFANLGPSIHHLNLAHGLAVKKYRAYGLKAPIGVAWNLSCSRPATNSKEDMKASLLEWDENSGVFVDPIFKGRYPESCIAMGYGFPIQNGDMEIISTPIDFVGLNYYSEKVVESKDEYPFYEETEFGQNTTEMGWTIIPEGLERLCDKTTKETNGIDLYITENGIACADMVENGRVHDQIRIQYLKEHIETMDRVIKKGIPLKGYYAWSFCDNFEWSFGYTKRFGLVYCDYATLSRIPKDSAYFLRDFITGCQLEE